MKKNNNISHFGGNHVHNSEWVMREAFLRSSREILDGCGIETYTVEQVRGMVTMLENYLQVLKDNE